MEKETVGTVISVAKQWWLKVNTKAVRMGALDGAIFPYIVKIRYVVEGEAYICRKWIAPTAHPPLEGTVVRVFYRTEKPNKAKVEI